MKKLLDLKNQVLRSGRARGKFMPGGIWDTAQGMNPYLENDTYRGAIAITAAPTDLTNGIVVDNPIAYTKDEQPSLYIMGDAGHFYVVSPNLALPPTDRRSATPINSPANGIAIFRPAGAASTLLYARKTAIGSYDLSGTYPTGWNDSAYSCGTTTPHRPFHRLFDRLYYGNQNYVGEFKDNGSGGITHTAQALDIDSQDTITALSDDGRYLILATGRLVADVYNAQSRSRIIFWDTNSDSWDWETTIPNEFSIRGIVKIGDVNYAVGKRGLYTVAFGVAPSLVYAFDSDETIAFDAVYYGHVNSLSPWGDGVIFGKLATVFSKFLPGVDRAVYNPLRGFTGDVSLIVPDFLENTTIVGTRSAKLYAFDMTSAGVGGPLTTRFIDLEANYHLQRLDLVCPNGPTGTITVTISGVEPANTVTLTIDETKYPGKRYITVPFGRNITTPLVKIAITFSSGTPAISDMSLWGEAAT